MFIITYCTPILGLQLGTLFCSIAAVLAGSSDTSSHCTWHNILHHSCELRQSQTWAFRVRSSLIFYRHNSTYSDKVLALFNLSSAHQFLLNWFIIYGTLLYIRPGCHMIILFLYCDSPSCPTDAVVKSLFLLCFGMSTMLSSVFIITLRTPQWSCTCSPVKKFKPVSGLVVTSSVKLETSQIAHLYHGWVVVILQWDLPQWLSHCSPCP